MVSETDGREKGYGRTVVSRLEPSDRFGGRVLSAKR
jgi:hypothetical protein